jgi:hypothetical protein
MNIQQETRDERLRRRETVIPTMAVTAVAIAAVVTAVMVKRGELGGEELVSQATPPAVTQQASPGSAPGATPRAENSDASVVTAPPLKSDSPKEPSSRAATSALGGTAACGNCGVVETVVAVHEYAKTVPSGYQMHIRMDDGSVRTVEQRGALAAGSRVKIEGGSVRALGAPGAG